MKFQGCSGSELFTMIFKSLCLIGIVAIGLSLARSIATLKMGVRYVSVKGIAECPVRADLAIWDIGYRIAGDNLGELTAKSLENQKIIADFLANQGFSMEEIELQRVEVLDQFAREYGGDKPRHRYILTCGITLRTAKVELMHGVSQKGAILLQRGVVLMNKNDYLPNPRYFYTKLDNIRPKMLEQATKSARIAAEQFAINSGSKIGSIRRANQGVFQILGLDSNAGSSYGSDNDQIGNMNKIVRVVVSLDYILE